MDRWVQRTGRRENGCSAGVSGSGGDPLTRRDRVLLLGMRSLIWAIDPLIAAPEGGVIVLCENEADPSRLEAQMDLLEPEHRPELLTGNLDALPASQARLVGGRLAAADLQGQNWTAMLKTINQHAEPTTGLRLLISRVELGPAGALQDAIQKSRPAIL